MGDDSIFIGGNVPSSKNSKRWTGKILINSKTTQRYIKATAMEYAIYRNKFISLLQGESKPYTVAFKFIRGSKHKFDYINPLQTVQDLMVKNNWIDDDNADELVPILDSYEYSKEEPGVFIRVIKQEDHGEESKQVLDKNRSRSSTQRSTQSQNDCGAYREEEGGEERRERECDPEDIHSGC